MDPSLSPRDIIVTGIIDNSIPSVRLGISALSRSRKGFDPAWGLSRAIKYAQPDMVRYMLDEGGASLKGLGPFAVGAAATVAVGPRGQAEGSGEEGEGEMERVKSTWQVLADRGWDVNAREPDE